MCDGSRKCFGLIALIFIIVSWSAAFAADIRPELEFQPASVTLPIGIGQQATALVVLHNRTDASLRDVRLTWLPAPGLDIQPPPPLSLSVLGAHADYVWTLTIKPLHGLPTPVAAGVTSISRPASAATTLPPGPSAVPRSVGPPETRIDQDLELRLDYKTAGGGQEVRQVTLKSLPAKTQDLADLDKALDFQIKAALDSLGSSESGSIYLVLKNNSARTINITSISPVGRGDLYCRDKKPQFHGYRTAMQEDSVPFCFSYPIPPAILTPYQTVVEELQVKANRRVKAGRYLLVFQIATQSYEGGVSVRHSLVVSQTVDVDVRGESAILKVAAVPLFFLLPGMLLLLAAGLCRALEGHWWPAADDEAFPLRFTDPSFWLISVIISLLIAIVPWMFTGRWYFTRFDLPNIALLWFASVLGGGVCYALWWAYRHNRRLHAEEHARMQVDLAARELQDRTFSEHDSR
jgi:hypothetical protein